MAGWFTMRLHGGEAGLFSFVASCIERFVSIVSKVHDENQTNILGRCKMDGGGDGCEGGGGG